jgi:hypothetical protein
MNPNSPIQEHFEFRRGSAYEDAAKNVPRIKSNKQIEEIRNLVEESGVNLNKQKMTAIS